MIMSTDVRCLAETDDPHPLVRIVGVLDLPTAAGVRGALLTCLADRPAAAVIDVSDLLVAAPDALTLLAAAAREAADWPTGQPVVCAPPTHPVEVWQAAEVAVLASLNAAFARIHVEAAAGRRLRADLLPMVGAARQARALVSDGCQRWNLGAVADSASIALTELVNNVVAHARTPMTVRLAVRDGALRIGVRDYSVAKPSFKGPTTPTSPGGRGLLLIDSVARHWGTSELDDGKVVWAVLHPDDEWDPRYA